MTDSIRGVRVFVSSTFRDMAAERDELMKHVFPALRHRCAARGATWSEVDLRWGVTDEQAAEGDVLPICLREIELSRPFFIGLLGERYGWIPPELPEDLVRQHTWLERSRGRSVTELEMLHGVLEESVRAGDAYFYLRDPSWLDGLPPADRSSYVDDEPDARRKLAALKDRVRASGLPVRVYEDPQHLAELVLQDFEAVIERHFPAGEPPDTAAAETREHAAFAATRCEAWVGRDADLLRLDTFADDPASPPLVVSGPSGSGKSALLANWLLRRRQAAPEQVLLAHYAGASPRSAEWPALCARLLEALGSALDLSVQVPEDPAGLPDALVRALAAAGAKVTAAGRPPVVVAIDGLDQVLVDEGQLPLHWLPDAAPPGVCLLLTCRPSPAFDELADRAWPRHDLEPLSPPRIRALAERYLARYAKALGPRLLDRLAAAPQAETPLFLVVLLDELRQHGDHFTLGEVLELLLDAATVDDLFEAVLDRWERDYQRETPDLVRRAFTLLRAGRRGLAEAELLALLGDEQPLPRARWSPLFLAAERHLILRDGRLSLAHRYLGQAIDDRYLAGAPTRDGLPTRGSPLTSVHDRLAGYFAALPLGPRVLAELPWHLAAARRWRELRDLLVRGDVMELSWELDPKLLEPRRLWALLERHSEYGLKDAVAPLRDRPETSLRHRSIAVGLLQLAGHLEDALALHRTLQDEADSPKTELAWSCSAGDMLASLGREDEADAVLDRAEQLARELGNDELLAHALRTRSRTAVARQDWTVALGYLAEAEAIHRRAAAPADLQRVLEDRARVLMQMEDLDAALVALDEQRHITQEIGDPVARAANTAARAEVAVRQGRFEVSAELHLEEAAIHREVGDRANLARALGAAAYSLEMLGRREEAARLLRESDALAAAARLTAQRATNLYALARLQRSAGDLAGARATVDELLSLAAEIDDDVLREQGLGVRGELRRIAGDLAGARADHEEQLQLATEHERPRGVALALLALAEVHLAAGAHEDADALLRDAEARLREQEDPSNLQVVLGVRARLAIGRGQGPEALRLLEAQLTHAQEAEVAAGILNALGNLGYVRGTLLGDLPGALQSFREQEAFARQVDSPQLLASCLWNQAGLASQMGQHDDATRLWTECLDLCRAAGLYPELRERLTTLAIAWYQGGQPAVALGYVDEALEISRVRLGDPDPPWLVANRGELLVALGRRDEGFALLESAARSADSVGNATLAEQIRALATNLGG